jgi:hypothetical protein
VASEQLSTGQKLKYLLLGSLSVSVGAWLAVRTIQADLLLLRVKRFGWWDFSDAVLQFAIVVYFVWWGANALRSSGKVLPATRIGWGKLLPGCTIVYATVRAVFVPQRNLFDPTIKAQTAGFDGVTVTVCLIGLSFILAAFVKKRTRPPVE